MNQSWGPRWSGMRWGHAVSRDLLAWTHLPVAINHWDGAYYDCPPWPAIFSGSVTLDDNGNPLVFYSVPCQTWVNGAVPKNRSDPLLLDWKKLGPIFNASDSVTHGSGDDGKGTDWGTTFRDPTTAWRSSDGTWWTAQACMNGTCLSKARSATADLQAAVWEAAGWFHRVKDSGTWECPDVFALRSVSNEGRFVLKANTAQGSACTGGPNNWWVVGRFDPRTGPARGSAADDGAFKPTSTEICGDNFDGIGNHLDFSGLFYASKSFTTTKGTQVLVSWVKEGGALDHGLNVSWAGVLSIPRTISLELTPTETLLTYPVTAVESLRGTGISIAGFGGHVQAFALQFDLDAYLPLTPGTGSEFAILLVPESSDEGVLAAPDLLLEVLISVNATGGGAMQLQGDSVPFQVAAGATSLPVRILMDRSICEVFVLRGKVAYTTRVYSTTPTVVMVQINNNGGTRQAAAAPIATLYPMKDAKPDPELESLAAAAWSNFDRASRVPESP